MGRQIRVEYAGATYHVITRGNRRSVIFKTPQDFEDYLADLERLAKEHKVQVLAFCLMDNHVHLCLRTTEGGSALSVFMQRLNLRHAKRFNRRYRVCGHLNDGRYRVQLVDSYEYLLALVAYIHRNPVAAGMVARLEDWQYSSHHAYLGQRYEWVKTDEVLRRVGGRERYLERMTTKQTAQERRQFEPDEKGRMPELAGHEAIQALGSLQVNPWGARFPRPKQPIQEAARDFARELGCDLGGLMASGRSAPPLAVRERTQLALALRRLGYRLREIGAVLGREETTVSRMLMNASPSTETRCAEAEPAYGLAA